MDGTIDPSAEDALAELVARYEESLAQGDADVELDLTSVACDAALLERWQGVKGCLDLVHRVQRNSSLAELDSSEVSHLEVDASLWTGLGLPKTLGRFEIQRRLGAGGVGLVYLARDPRLGRQVALKVPRLETLANADLRNRFLREAEAAARLSHPNVVPVLESGQDDLLCYIAAEYCEGPTLAQWLAAQNGFVPVQQAATIVRQLSSAVQHAHSRGVLHRDIKPGNVLIVTEASTNDSTGGQQSLVPKLTDFGMAKLVENDGQDETHTGTTIGTPAYMAPEQAAGRVRELDSRTDVYALGAVLYELLTGEPPFRGETPLDVLRRVLDHDPVSIRRLRADVPLDLEAICLQCLAKRPAERYQTAQQLVDDLDRFLAREPILARPPGLLEGIWKWARRHPLAMGTAAIVTGALVVLSVVTSVYNARLASAIVRADREAETSRQLLYSANVQLAQESLRRGNVPQTLQLLDDCVPHEGQPDLREFSWHYLKACCNQQVLTLEGHEGDVFAVAYSPDGSTVATGGKDHTVRIWDAVTGNPIRILSGHTSEVPCIAFSPSADLLATGSEDHTVRLWDWRTGAQVRVIDASQDHILALAFSPDGSLLATSGREKTVRVWNLADGSLVQELSTQPGVGRALLFSPDGSSLISGDEESAIRVWKTNDWSPQHTVHRPSEIYFSLAQSPQAKLLAAAGRRHEIEIYRFDGPELKMIHSIVDASVAWIQTLAFNPTNATLASSGKDGIIRLWSPETWRVTRTIVGHSQRVWSVAWSPDGRRLASASADGQVRIWDTAVAEALKLPVSQVAYRGLADLPDSSLVACDSYGQLRYWGRAEMPIRQNLLKQSVTVRNSEFSHDRRWIALRDYSGQLAVWQTDRSTAQWTIKTPTGHVKSPIAWSFDDQFLAMNPSRSIVAVYAAKSGKPVAQIELGQTVWDCAFTPEGTLVISHAQGLMLWDHRSSTVRWRLQGAHHQLAVSPDGAYIATDRDTQVVVVDAMTGDLVAQFVPEGGVQALAVSPDNRTLAVAVDAPSRIELWDLLTRRPLVSIPISARLKLEKLKFARDGVRLLVAGDLDNNGGSQILEFSASNDAGFAPQSPFRSETIE